MRRYHSEDSIIEKHSLKAMGNEQFRKICDKYSSFEEVRKKMIEEGVEKCNVIIGKTDTKCTWKSIVHY